MTPGRAFHVIETDMLAAWARTSAQHWPSRSGHNAKNHLDHSVARIAIGAGSIRTNITDLPTLLRDRKPSSSNAREHAGFVIVGGVAGRSDSPNHLTFCIAEEYPLLRARRRAGKFA
jgi:hypothetical protein